MAMKLETIKGGGGSVRIGTVGTISSLMNRELESAGSSSCTPSSSRLTPSTNPVSGSSGYSTVKRRKSMDDACTSRGARSSIKRRSSESTRRPRSQSRSEIPVLGATTPKQQKHKASPPEEGSSRRSPPEFLRKTGRSHRRTLHAPMLGSENATLDRTPNREKSGKKGINIVDVVDTSCGSPRGSLADRLKKLGFSKLSQSII